MQSGRMPVQPREHWMRMYLFKRCLATAALMFAFTVACDDPSTPKECSPECGECERCVSGSCEVDESLLSDCGTCGEGPPEVCWDELDNDCDGEVDEGCFGTFDQCIGVTCTTPPPPDCGEDGGRVVYGSGSCTEGKCTYEPIGQPCEFGCAEGECLSDPCNDMECNDAPSVCYGVPGACVGGECSYEPADGASCDDLDPCTVEDACTDGACHGQPVVCDEPPADSCVSSTTLRKYVDVGACEASGECFYEYEHVQCELGCLDGACKGDPCTGVECVTPPGQCFANPGTCSDGVCSYPPLLAGPCDDDDPCTEQDACSEGGCAGTPKVCDEPPGPECADEVTVRSYSANGACEDGQCAYPLTDVPCEVGCVNGQCATDPCDEMTCDVPPGVCYEPLGTCAAGSCSYAAADGGECDDGDPCTIQDLCGAGACAGTKMVCDEPPLPECTDPATLRSYSSNGVCDGGQCVYEPQDVACEFGCDAGACNGDPCADVTCDLPPTACHSPEGTCSGGACTYPLQPGWPCDDGDPCTVKDTCGAEGACTGQPKCQNPGQGICLDAMTYYGPTGAGACQPDGGCLYPEVEIHCDFGCQFSQCVVP